MHIFYYVNCIPSEHDASCPISSDSDCLHDEKSKYSQDVVLQDFDDSKREHHKWLKFINERRIALDNYSRCESIDSCSCFIEQIDSDLAHWKGHQVSNVLLNASKELGVFYQIIDKQLYRQKECYFPARCEGIEYFLLKIAGNLNDVEFVVNVRDWAQIINDPRRYHMNSIPLPLFSFSKEPEWYKDILYPAWAFWTGGPSIGPYPRGIGDWGHLRNTIAKHSLPWSQKTSIAFFRGSRTSADRDPLILLSRAKPDLLDAQYTKNQAWRSIADTLGREPASEIRFEEQCRYKYLLNMRGVAASFRFKHLFLCSSTVINVNSNLIEYFYPQLKPWIHYVPVDNDPREIEDVINFLRENDQIAKEIAGEGFSFIFKYLTVDSVTCYWEQLLTKYHTLLDYVPTHDKTLIKINKNSNKYP